MPEKIKTNREEDGPLQQLLRDTDGDLKDLFIKVMNLHAGYQIVERSSAQLVAEVRKEIENSLSETD
jgi:hypothetical protein